MGNCEMCGKEGSIIKAMVESIEMDLCSGCSVYGKRLEPKSDDMIYKPRIRPPISSVEDRKGIVNNFSEIIRKKRNQLGMTQEEFAKKLAEKESIVTKMESGSFTPSIPKMEKIEKILNVTLIEEMVMEKFTQRLKESGPLTMGDIIKVRKR